MADNSKIEWTDATWNPITGCAVVSPGCTNCYAMKLAGAWLQHHPSRAGHGADVSDLEHIKTRVRSILAIQSMAELNTDEIARKRWLSLGAKFGRWRKRR